MSIWQQLRHGMRTLFKRAAADQDVDDEVQHFIDEAAREYAARGMSPEQAQRAARLATGNTIAIREQVREHRWENTIQMTMDEIRYALRRLARKPGFTAVSLLTAALGIGATVAIFSVLNGILLQPLPYPGSDRLVALQHTAPGVNIKDLSMAPSLYFTYREESRTLESVSLWASGAVTVTGFAEPERTPFLSVTQDFLPSLGQTPVSGREFSAADMDPRSERTVLLTHGYWKQRFNADRSIIGRRILLDGSAHEIIGVLPDSFQFLDRAVSLVLPMRLDRANTFLLQFSQRGIARLKPGVTIEQANADIARCLQIAPSRFPMNPGMQASTFRDARIQPALRTLKDDLIGDIGNTLWILMAAVGMVLLIACANIANLLLVRADGRQQELAVRSALGAGSGRIARELLTESLLLGAAGGALGVGLAYAALQVLVRSDLSQLPRLSSIAIDPAALLFALVLSLLAGIGFGLIPVLKYARPNIADVLRGAGGRAASLSRERHRARGVLVVIQVALALILLVSSGLMVRSFQALRSVDPGYTDPQHVRAVFVSIPSTQVNEPERVLQMHEAILGKFQAISGVHSVGISHMIPTQGTSSMPVYAEGELYGEGKLPPARYFKYISPGYITAMGARLIAGRDLTWTDVHAAAPVALISENFAREVWGSPQSAVGRRIRTSPTAEWKEITGVIADLRDDGVDRPAPALVYCPLFSRDLTGPATTRRNVNFLIRSPRTDQGFGAELRQALMSVNPSLPLSSQQTLAEVQRRSMARTSFTMALLAVAGSMALILGVIGLYGVIAYIVSQRTRDIGIRIALGASTQGVTGLFVRQGLLLSAIGVVCGLAGSLILTRWMKSLLFGVEPLDPATYAFAIVSLILAALIASWIPARRAAAVDPIEALRSE
jgi:putative ABC transport system permease protein